MCGIVSRAGPLPGQIELGTRPARGHQQEKWAGDPGSMGVRHIIFSTAWARRT